MKSHPMWVRGLKYLLLQVYYLRHCAVAPHVGAWIEMSVPMCGHVMIDVAPHVGAWIEILVAEARCRRAAWVAPHVGAWIEIYRPETTRRGR